MSNGATVIKPIPIDQLDPADIPDSDIFDAVRVVRDNDEEFEDALLQKLIALPANANRGGTAIMKITENASPELLKEIEDTGARIIELGFGDVELPPNATAL